MASQNFFHIHRSAKCCLEILDELFGRDRRVPDQILDQLAVAPITAIVIAVPRPLFACFVGQLLEQSLRPGESSVDGIFASVKSGHFGVSERRPLYPEKRTWISRAVMSALCQKRTHALQQLMPACASQ